MKTKLDILKWLTPLALLLATACGYDELVVPDDSPEEKETPYVELRIAVPLANPATTRANPMGGEEGNGREKGVLNEDKIHDINIFFYDDSKSDGEGMNSDPETPIVDHLYYNVDDNDDPLNSKLRKPEDETDPIYYDNHYLTLQFACTEELLARAEGLKFLAIANLGPKQFSDNMKLKDLTGLQLEYYDYNSKGSGNPTWSTTNDAFSNNASNMDYFLMSTAYNDNHTYDEYGISATGTNTIVKDGGKYSGTTTLQRVYARLDLWYNHDNAIMEETGDNAKVKELKYAIVDDKDNVVKGEDAANHFADVYITNVLPVNVMQKPSFLFKNVIELPASNKWDALTNNTVWNSKSTVWTTGTSKWGGKESPNDLPYSSEDQPLNYVLEPTTTLKSSNGRDGDLTAWYGSSRTEQVKTNITSPANGPMSGYYHGTPNSATATNYGCDRIAIISYANENTHPTDCYHSNYLTGMAFRAVYVPEKIYSYGEVTDAEGNTTVKLTEVTSVPEGKIYRYSWTTKNQEEKNSLYFTDRNEAEKYAEAHPQHMAIITPQKPSEEDEDAYFTATEHVVGKDADGRDIKKWGFVCYYNLWLRHYNNEAGDPTENYPMEYATVRNNIYRVAVSFRGPGDPTPTMREPDTMKARIFVRKWNYREEDKLVYD